MLQNYILYIPLPGMPDASERWCEAYLRRLQEQKMKDGEVYEAPVSCNYRHHSVYNGTSITYIVHIFLYTYS